MWEKEKKFQFFSQEVERNCKCKRNCIVNIAYTSFKDFLHAAIILNNCDVSFIIAIVKNQSSVVWSYHDKQNTT